jgi:hypothetical protein
MTLELLIKVFGPALVIVLTGWGNHLAAGAIKDRRRRALTRWGLWILGLAAIALVGVAEITSERDAANRSQAQISEYERYNRSLFAAYLNPKKSKASPTAPRSPKETRLIAAPPALQQPVAAPKIEAVPKTGSNSPRLSKVPKPQKTPFDLLDFRCQNGRTSIQPQQTFVISNDTLRLYYNAVAQAFFPDVQQGEPKMPAVSVATCTVIDDSNVPIYRLELVLAWEVAQNGVKMTLPGRLPLYVGRVTNESPVAFRFANGVPGRAVVIAPTIFCWVELPGGTDYQKCTLTRFPHLDARDPAWKDLKEPPTLMAPDVFTK